MLQRFLRRESSLGTLYRKSACLFSKRAATVAATTIGIARKSHPSSPGIRTIGEPISGWGLAHFRGYHHRACGYLAGLHAYQAATGYEETSDFASFEEAWEALLEVPHELLDDFEAELWETQGRRFVHGTKRVSVIDCVSPGEEDDDAVGKDDPTTTAATNKESPNQNRSIPKDESSPSRVVRYLILNERPNLIQTAVEVSRVGAPYHHYDHRGESWIPKPPAPLSQTHLGGLAMALPLWYRANAAATTLAADESLEGTIDATPTNGSNTHDSPGNSFLAPNCLLIGAGGCSLAHTIAARLCLATKANDTQAPAALSAVEACPEILEASKLWFGAGSSSYEEGSSGESGSGKENDASRPPCFDLVHATGEKYLESLLETSSSRVIDVLIVDAEDGSAPPASMQTLGFWRDLVLPNLCQREGGCGFVVGVNVIGTPAELLALTETLRMALAAGVTEDYTVLAVPPPPQARVNDRHKLLFAIPTSRENTTEEPILDLEGWVDAPDAWEAQLRQALRQA